MARPWRRVLIGLSIRTGLGLSELESYDAATIRHYLGMLSEINKPAGKSSLPTSSKQQTPEEMMAAVNAALGHLKE
jgi:hypothetical protein